MDFLRKFRKLFGKKPQTKLHVIARRLARGDAVRQTDKDYLGNIEPKILPSWARAVSNWNLKYQPLDQMFRDEIREWLRKESK